MAAAAAAPTVLCCSSGLCSVVCGRPSQTSRGQRLRSGSADSKHAVMAQLLTPSLRSTQCLSAGVFHVCSGRTPVARNVRGAAACLVYLQSVQAAMLMKGGTVTPGYTDQVDCGKVASAKFSY